MYNAKKTRWKDAALPIEGLVRGLGPLVAQARAECLTASVLLYSVQN